MSDNRQVQIAQLENVMEFPERYVPQGVTATREDLRVIAREALFMKLDLEQAR